MRTPGCRNHADDGVSVLLRVFELRGHAVPEKRRLLCFLLIRHGAVPSDPAAEAVLWLSAADRFGSKADTFCLPMKSGFRQKPLGSPGRRPPASCLFQTPSLSPTGHPSDYCRWPHVPIDRPSARTPGHGPFHCLCGAHLGHHFASPSYLEDD